MLILIKASDQTSPNSRRGQKKQKTNSIYNGISGRITWPTSMGIVVVAIFEKKKKEKEEESSSAFPKKYGRFIPGRMMLGDLYKTKIGKAKSSLNWLPNHLYFAKFIVSHD